MNKTGIDYLDYTYNPIAMRCTPCSPGCTNCWHIKTADRMSMNFHSFPLKIRSAYAGERPPVLVEDRLADPLKRKKPSIVGTQLMGDLFHESIKFEWIAAIFGIMAFAQNHTFIVLTKRPERMLEFFAKFHDGDYARNLQWWKNEACQQLPQNETFGIRKRPEPKSLPLPNVIGMVTAENQEQADIRIPILLKTPFAIRGMSVEPMLSGINIEKYLPEPPEEIPFRLEYLNWVICAPETGPKRRPYKIEWIKNLKNQCIETSVPFFLKHLFEGNKKTSTPELDKQKWIQFPK